MIHLYRMDGSLFNAQLVTKVIVFIGCITAVYYLWRFFAETGGLKDGIVFSNTGSALLANATSPLIINGDTVPQLYAGGEYSISTWIYVTNWSVNSGKNKVFLMLSGGGGTAQTLIMYLGQNVNKLGIRTSTTGSLLDSSQFSSIIAGSTPYSDTATDFKMCDIETVDLQKWVNITVVLSGTTLDVYIDGKLSRSCVLPKVFTTDGDKTTITLGGTTPPNGTQPTSVTRPNGFGGYIGQTRAANYAYSPDQVYLNYLNGPSDKSLWSQLVGSLNPKWFAASCQMDKENLLAQGSSYVSEHMPSNITSLY